MMTNVYELDGTQMQDSTAAHDYLMEAMGFPAWYGKNLDALYDMLTAYGAPTMIFIEAADDADEDILRVFSDAMEENPQLTIIMED